MGEEAIKLLNILRTMLKIRYFELKAIELYTTHIIKGSLHPSIGQEAIAVGVCSALEKEDYILSTHRGAGHCIAKGMEIKNILAELAGKSTGCCKGKGGPMHLADVSKGVLGTNGIVGAGIPIAVGVGKAIKFNKQKHIVVCFFGDGASNQGSFHEAFNLASLWKVPVVFICENNYYGLSTPITKVLPVKNIADRMSAYGMEGKIVDGNDVLAVYNLSSEVVKQVREGAGPVLIEAITYRIEGHYYGDPCNYRTKEEVESWRAKDPIIKFQKYLIKEKILSETKLREIEEEIKQEIKDAEKFTMESPEPELSTAIQEVYS